MINNVIELSSGAEPASAADRAATGRRTVVLGLGNILLADEGVGVHTVTALRDDFGADDDVELIDGGTLSFTLAEAVHRAHSLIIIDAAQLHAEPGAVEVFEGAAMDHFVMTRKNTTVHEVSLFDLLAIAELCGQVPDRRALVGVQPRTIDWSDSMTEDLQRAVPEVARVTRALIQRWRTPG